MRRFYVLCLGLVLLGMTAVTWAEPLDIGSRRELMVDDYLIDRFEDGTRLELHHPTAREVVLKHDRPWSGNNGSYYTAFKDGDLYRMYYLSYQVKSIPQDAPGHEMYACYAESTDGIHWKRPELGLFQHNGSKKNNIIWVGPEAHDFTPFKDTNPDCKPDAKYKAVGFDYSSGGQKLRAFKSPDGIHWKKLQEKPIIIGYAFDSQNQAFWDPVENQYRCYFRNGVNGLRGILFATSKDFVNWTAPQPLQYTGYPPEEFYINVISRYYRAPQIFVGFPTRYVERKWLPSHNHLPDLKHRKIRSKQSLRHGTAVTDGTFMSSRDGLNFHRWGEAFIRPGPQRDGNWAYGDNYQCMGLFETPSDRPGAENELSFYVDENAWRPDHQLRRYTIRIDGFVSVNAPRSGGGFTTKPLLFDGKELEMNFSSSAAGSIRVEIQDAAGKPIKGFTLADADETFGDTLARAATWKGKTDVSSLAGKPVRLRLVMSDADLYSFRFKK